MSTSAQPPVRRDPADTAAESTAPAPVRRRVRRSPNYVAFLVTGAFLGFIAGALVDAFGASTMGNPGDPVGQATYSASTSLGFIGAIGALVGLLLGALVALALDRRR